MGNSYILMWVSLISSLFGFGFFVGGCVLVGNNNHRQGQVYKEYNCSVSDATIGILNICNNNGGNIYSKNYMAVWKVSFTNNKGNNKGNNNGNNNNMSMIIKPIDHHRNISEAFHDILNGPKIGSITLCMCDLNYISSYPSLDDGNDLDCNVWKACFNDVSYIESLDNKVIYYKNMGLGLIYAGILLEFLAWVLIVIYATRPRKIDNIS